MKKLFSKFLNYLFPFTIFIRFQIDSSLRGVTFLSTVSPRTFQLSLNTHISAAVSTYTFRAQFRHTHTHTHTFYFNFVTRLVVTLVKLPIEIREKLPFESNFETKFKTNKIYRYFVAVVLFLSLFCFRKTRRLCAGFCFFTKCVIGDCFSSRKSAQEQDNLV